MDSLQKHWIDFLERYCNCLFNTLSLDEGISVLKTIMSIINSFYDCKSDVPVNRYIHCCDIPIFIDDEYKKLSDLSMDKIYDLKNDLDRLRRWGRKFVYEVNGLAVIGI